LINSICRLEIKTEMNLPAASSGVSPGDIILFAASGGEFDPERLNFPVFFMD
jgi:hypothetical protein